MWDPGAVGNEGLGRSHLLRVVPRHEADQDIGINGAHGALWRTAAGLPSAPSACAASEEPSGTVPDERPRTNDDRLDAPRSLRPLRPTPTRSPGPGPACDAPRPAPRSDLVR